VRYFLTAMCIAYCHVLSSQSFPFIGPAANGIGYASSCSADEWAVYNNPAGARSSSETRVAFTYDAFPGFVSFHRIAAVVALPLRNGGFNAGVFRFGDELYNEHVITAAYAQKLGISTLGISIKYLQVTAEGFGSNGVATFSAGGITELAPWLKAGAYVVNLTQPKIAEQEKIPTFLLFGISLKASDKVAVLIEAEKDIGEDTLIKVGVEYRQGKKFVLRTGFHPAPAAGFFGFGFRMKKLQLDYAFSYLSQFGNRHQAGIGYVIKGKQ
jgi:hypothetical protein